VISPSDKIDGVVDEIIFQVEPCEDSGFLVASWDAPPDQGGITTQGRDLRELQEQVADAVRCHFGPEGVPRKIRFHFVADPVLVDL
jgi:hypothetical protein